MNNLNNLFEKEHVQFVKAENLLLVKLNMSEKKQQQTIFFKFQFR